MGNDESLAFSCVAHRNFNLSCIFKDMHNMDVLALQSLIITNQ